MRWLERRAPPPVVAIVAALVIWWLARTWPSLTVTSVWQSAAALALALTGIGLDITAVLAFRRARTTVNPLNPDAAKSLVTTGPNAFSRNPMYLGLALIVSAVALHVGALPGALVVVGFVLYLTRFQIIPEERAMHRLFGESYQRYQCAVRRWI